MTGQELKALRKAAGLTQEAAVRLCGIKSGDTSWSRWETGRAKLDPLKADAIRRILERAARKNPGTRLTRP